jgi:hypothetical protein
MSSTSTRIITALSYLIQLWINSASADDIPCGLYLAESTIPGAGMGIFAGHEYKVGETVGRGDVCIPFIDMYW